MEKGIELKTRIDSLVPQMLKMVETEVELLRSEEWIKAINRLKTDAGKARVKKPEFSFDSAKQVMNLLYKQLELPEQTNPKTKKPSVDYDSLKTIEDLHPIVSKLLEYRETQKVYGTYIEGTIERMVDGRIYPSFNTSGTVTGRISHSNPNMGNMPSGGGIRGLFVPDPGTVFISADFSQLEVRISAHFTRDENLLRIINDGVSLHDITANSLGILRGLAKTLNFGMQFGCSAYKVANVLGVSLQEGQKAYAKYWETYSGQKAKMDECARFVDTGVPIINPFGRRRRFEVKKRPAWDTAYRQSFNALIQGTGSDCTSWAFYTTDQEFRSKGWGRGIMTLHDEALMMVKKEYAEQAKDRLVEIMEQAGAVAGLTVKLKAEPCIMNDRWLD
jgi:DNA polymerase-1